MPIVTKKGYSSLDEHEQLMCREQAVHLLGEACATEELDGKRSEWL
jgi:hypothetical protein